MHAGIINYTFWGIFPLLVQKYHILEQDKSNLVHQGNIHTS